MASIVRVTAKQYRKLSDGRVMSVGRLAIGNGTPAQYQGDYKLPSVDQANVLGWLSGKEQLKVLKEWDQKGYKQ